MTPPLAVVIATGFFVSTIPLRLAEASGPRRPSRLSRWTGMGFAGTLLGWALFVLLPEDPPALAAALALGTAAAVWAAGGAEKAFGVHDDPRIVIDEVVGFWVAGAFLPRTLPYLASAFLFFRLFDAVKLPPYSWLERLPGGWGVVLDDVGAGVVANACARLAGGWLS